MANPTKDQLTINALRERVRIVETDNKACKNLLNDFIDDLGNKNLIIQDQKSVIIEYKSIVLDKEIDIESLQLENKELNNRLSFKDKLFNFIVYPILVISVISLVITLWK